MNSKPAYKIGVDGGGTKTELILIDEAGEIVSRHIAPGSNPNIIGPENARAVLLDALGQLHRDPVSHTHLYMGGAPLFWREFGANLTDFGEVSTFDDSRPVLELATQGQPGLVLHGGTGSFVSARAPDNSIHYGGGFGWRFGDPGSGYDLGKRAIAAAIPELQGWGNSSRLGQLVRDHTKLPHPDSHQVLQFYYQTELPTRTIASLAPAVLHLAVEGDENAVKLVRESAQGLLDLAVSVATKLFPDSPLDEVPAGLSGPIMTHPAVTTTLIPHSPLPLVPIKESPIRGVYNILTRL